jgi:hypothetical protein
MTSRSPPRQAPCHVVAMQQDGTPSEGRPHSRCDPEVLTRPGRQRTSALTPNESVTRRRVRSLPLTALAGGRTRRGSHAAGGHGAPRSTPARLSACMGDDPEADPTCLRSVEAQFVGTVAFRPAGPDPQPTHGRLSGSPRTAPPSCPSRRGSRPLHAITTSSARTGLRAGSGSPAMNWARARSAKRPPLATSSSKLPVSTMRPWSRTRIL